MATMSVSLSDPMKEWVETQAKSSRYADPGEFVRDLIQREKTRLDKIDAMQRLVDEGLASGIGSRSADDLFAEAEARAARKSWAWASGSRPKRKRTSSLLPRRASAFSAQHRRGLP